MKYLLTLLSLAGFALAEEIPYSGLAAADRNACSYRFLPSK
jgi:hypothetical protein